LQAPIAALARFLGTSLKGRTRRKYLRRRERRKIRPPRNWRTEGGVAPACCTGPRGVGGAAARQPENGLRLQNAVFSL